MPQYILDTDHVSLWLEGHPSVQLGVSQSGLEVAITIITVQELFNGWTTRINDPKQAKRLVSLYTKLWLVVGFLQSISILNNDSESSGCSSLSWRYRAEIARGKSSCNSKPISHRFTNKTLPCGSTILPHD